MKVGVWRSRAGGRLRRESTCASRGVVPFTCLMLLAVGGASAATFNVNDTGDAGDANAGNGVCATAGAVCTLRAAVEEANALGGADTINVPAGLYLTSSRLDVTQQLTVLGAGSAATIVDAGGNDRVFDITGASSVALSDLTVRNGDAGSNSGGGISTDTTLTLTNVILSGNTTTGHGGGIYSSGGAISLTMIGCTVVGNSADRAAGVNFKDSSGTLTLTDVEVRGNTGTDEGCGIRVLAAGSTALFNRVTSSGNSCPFGAGIYLKDFSTATLDNVTISGNTITSPAGGGGLLTATGNVTVTNGTITSNSAPAGAGGGVRQTGGTLQFRNTLVAGNAGDDCRGTIVSLGNNLDQDGTCGFALTADPLLGPLQDNGGPTETHAPGTGSPAIDAGTNVGCPAVDQRGQPRPVDGDGDLTATCDIGAFEVQGPSVSGTVFEDADFTGTAAGWDGGTNDLGLVGVDVELYGAADTYLASTTTDSNGFFSFTGVALGSYKVRARAATLGDADTVPAGGYNGCVPATCSYPVPEMTWAGGAAAYGGQSPTADDTTTGDDAGPGDNWVAVTVSGPSVTGVDLGFAFNPIVNTNDAGQGTLRQFLLNANAIGTAGGTTANSGEFRMQVAANRSDAADAWWRVTTASALPVITDSGTTLDGSTQRLNSGVDSNSRGPEIELFGNGIAGSGLEVAGTANAVIRELVVNSFQDHGIHIHGAGADGTRVFGCYIGTDAVGEVALPNTDFGVWVNDNTSNTDIGGPNAGEGNLISGNGDQNTEPGISIGLVSGSVRVRGNLIGTDRTGTSRLANRGGGISISGADGVTVGGSASGEGNIIAGNDGDGIRIVNWVRNVSIQGNKIGAGSTGTETLLGNAGFGVFITSFYDPSNIVVGGLGTGEGNLIAYSTNGIRSQTSGQGDGILGNVIRNNGLDAISSGTDGLLIAKNELRNNGLVGVTLTDDPGTSASNNDVYHNTIHGSGSHGVVVAGGGVLLRNNIVTGSGGYGINVTTGAMTESHNTVTDASTNPANASGRSNVALDATSLVFDPRYANEPAGDLSLTECLSPPIDLGLDLGVDQPDLNGPAAGNFNGTAPDMGAFESACSGPTMADAKLTKTDAPDPAPAAGSLVYTLVVTNGGPATATGVAVVDTLPAEVTLVSATPSQGSCSGTTTITCNLGAILDSGTASVEILVTTSTVGSITNNASVTQAQTDPVPADNAVVENTDVVVSGTSDVPLTQFRRFHGFLDYTVTGGSLRTQANDTDPCAVGAVSVATVSGLPVTATVSAAYLYWAGSGSAVDNQVTFDAVAVTADRTFQGQFNLGADSYDFFSGFEDVTTQVQAKGNGSYAFQDLAVDTGAPYCSARAVLAGWALIVVYEDNALTGKTLVLYDGFDIERNGSTSYLLTGIFAADPPQAATTVLVWEGDSDLGGTDERLEFNGSAQSDGLNPADNVYNSTINSLPSTTSYGLDLDTFDVSAEVSAGDTLATVDLFTGPDLVILNAAVLQVKSNIIVGHVFEDVNHGGGAGRDRITASADAPSFAVGRPGATVELYTSGGSFLRTTTSGATGQYGFAGLVDGDYQVRVVNQTVTSSRPSATGSEWSVQTYRTDASTGATLPVAGEVGGADPQVQDSGANVATADLGTFTAQSVAPVRIQTGLAVVDVDFGYNFDTVVNTNDAGQGSLRQFLSNANSLGNANLDQDGLAPGLETSLFTIPSNADPWGRVKDSGFDAARGVAVISPVTALPALIDGSTAVDGTTQTTAVGDTNAGQLGTGGTVGADALPLSLVNRPEIEIAGGGTVEFGLQVQASDAVVRGLSIHGFRGAGSTGSSVSVTTAVTGVTVEENVIGSVADAFADPGGGLRSRNGLVVVDADTGTIRRNLVGHTQFWPVRLHSGADGWQVSDNEIVNVTAPTWAVGFNSTQSDCLAYDTSTGALVTGNRLEGCAAFGLAALSPGTYENNTVRDAGVGDDFDPPGPTAGILARTGAVVRRNVVQGNRGPGVLVWTGENQVRITENLFGGNGGNSIDLLAPGAGGLDFDHGDGITPNGAAPPACGYEAGGANDGIDAPLLEVATLTGGSATVSGMACPGGTVEIYRAVADGDGSDALGGNDHGEGVAFLGATTAAGTGAFSLTGLGGLVAGDTVSLIVHDVAGNTSEFAAGRTVSQLALVKRAFQTDGTPIAHGTVLPRGTTVRFMIYLDNPAVAVADASVRDVLDAAFTYQAGSMKVDNTLASSAVCPGGVCDEVAIFTQVAGAGTPVGDGDAVTAPIDADVASYTSGTTTIDAGDGSNTDNLQLDLAADSVWALVYSVTIR